MNSRRGWLFALAATIVYSTNTPVARGAILEGMSPATLLIARFSLAALLYSLTLSVTPARHLAGNRPLDHFGFWVSVGTGLLNGFMITAFFTALETVSASIASMISIALTQLFTLGLLSLQGERLTRRNLVRLLVGLGGLYVLVGAGGSADPFGLLLLFTGSALFSIHIVSVQWFLKPYNVWITTTLIVVSATVAILMLWLATGADMNVPVPLGWLAILVQGIVATFIGRILTYSAINRIGSGQFALLSPLETSLTIVWSVIFLGERLTGIQWLGTLFILISTCMAADVVWRFMQRIVSLKAPPSGDGYNSYDKIG